METRNQSLYTQDGRRKYVTPAERTRFVIQAQAHPDERIAVLCLVLAFTGCRISEALSLRSMHINADDRCLAFISLKKRGKLVVRELPIPDDLLRRLVALAADGEDRLFPWSRSRAWFHVKQVIETANIMPGPHATAKGLRHGFGIHAIRCGVPITFVRRWFGHARLSTTEIYLDAIGPEEREIAARMWDSRR